MLKKLKRKFVMINMCLVGMVLAIVFVVACINTYQNDMREVEGALNMAIDNTREEKPAPFEIGTPPDGKKIVPTENGFKGKPFNYAAVVMSIEYVDGERRITILNKENASLNTEVMDSAVETVLTSDVSQGKLKEMDLFYLKAEDVMEVKIAFADSTYFDAKIKKTVTVSVMLFILGMLALLLISILLAEMAVAPVKKTWAQQKRFIADASHELKTPLTVLLANNEILMEMTENKESRKWLESSQEEALHMKNLVEDLLFLAKADESLDAKKAISDAFTENNMTDIVTGVMLQMEPIIFEAGAMFESDVDSGIKIRCDATQIKQLIHILLDNAAKYCGEKGRIKLSLTETADMVELKVTNTGDVIPNEEIEHIFERFYRSDKARTSTGYGLGLSIAKTIAESHNGEIFACSNEDGTTMTVKIKK